MKLPSLKQIGSFFKGKRERGYRELASIGGVNSDWKLNTLSEDGDLWQNAWALTSRVRDLFKSNTNYISYRENFWANVYGADGIMFRSQVKEQEDRVIHSTDEKAAIREYEARRNLLLKYTADKEGRSFEPVTLLREFGNNGSRVASVKIGEPDVYARKLIEEAWKEWQQAKYCDVRGTRNYKTIRQIRGISTVRDGDFFIQLIRNPKVNKFGFTLRMINSEWCDRFFNATLPNKNEIRMGIEYEFTDWGLGKVVAYHFIKRQPLDWQYSVPGLFGYGTMPAGMHDRVDARDIVHLARAVDADGTRPAPWVASTIPMARHLDQYQISEVIAARIQATRLGWLYSDVVPEGGFTGDVPNPSSAGQIEIQQGVGYKGLPWGVKVQESDPKHPNMNFPEFRKAMLQAQCAGMPGANYSTMAADYAAINFSAGRLQRLDSQELYKLIQCFDIEYAEAPIFEAWLEMSLLTGAIKLPAAKFNKFNVKSFSGRRWRGVDDVKEATASALRIANKISSRTRENADIGQDFEEVLQELAEEEMLIEQYGLNSATTVEKPEAPEDSSEDDAEDAAENETETEKPEKKKAVKKRRGKSRIPALD